MHAIRAEQALIYSARLDLSATEKRVFGSLPLLAPKEASEQSAAFVAYAQRRRPGADDR